MFCEKCGTQLADTASFCNKCGNSVNEPTVQNVLVGEQPDTEVLLKVRPKFKLSYFLCSPLFNFKFVYLVMMAMLAMVYICQIYSSIVTPVTGLICIVGILIFLLIIISFKMLFKMAQIKNMKYDFYRTKVEYTDSFLDKLEREVKYKNIKEVVLIRRAIDRIWGYGTIRLYTSADGGRGIIIPCVENSERVYKEIKELLEK